MLCGLYGGLNVLCCLVLVGDWFGDYGCFTFRLIFLCDCVVWFKLVTISG